MEGQVANVEQEVIITNNNLLLHFSGHNNDLLLLFYSCCFYPIFKPTNFVYGPREKLQCLYENLKSNNFRNTSVLKKYQL